MPALRWSHSTRAAQRSSESTDSMLTSADFIKVLGLIVVGAPALSVVVLGVASLVEHRPSERAVSRIVAATTSAGLLAAIAVLGLMMTKDTRHLTVQFGDWVVIPHYHFSVKLIFDLLSVPFAILSLVLCGTIGAFASGYMHREPGYHRFFVLYVLFVLGMVLTSLAGTIETLFAGWELVGLSSALLVAFYQERSAPVRNGLRVWVVYRVSDAALLIAAIALHHLTGEGDFDKLFGTGPWPGVPAAITSTQALFVGLLFLIAAAGKSALVPFSGWLPRAMEGPTPSSAIFYGALSVHLGAYLLLRVSPMLTLSPVLCAVIVAVGLVTAVFAWMAGRAQTDIKAALSFACLTQVGLIVAEIGLGLRFFALAHIIGHGCLRTLQFVRAPSLLLDYRTLENAIGGHLPPVPSIWTRLLSQSSRRWFYRLALERGYLDAWLTDFIARPFVQLFQGCDLLERRWTDFLSGGRSRESDQVKPHSGALEEL